MSVFEQELDLITRAKRGDTIAIQQLFQKYRSFLDYKAGAFSRATIPQQAVKAEAYKLFMIALKKYDPRTRVNGAPVRFKTFLENQVRLDRYVHSNKSVVRLPENKLLNISNFSSTKSSLNSMFKREPTPVEMAQHLGWRVSQVDAMERSLGRTLLSASESDERNFGISFKDKAGGRLKETKEYVYYTLTSEEQHVFDYSDGAHGKKKLSAEKVAAKLGISLDKVYRIRRKIDKKLFGYF